MGQHSYSFTALRGIQAGREYYLVMCPLKLIPRVFLFDEPEVPPELRAQRILNRTRIPEITRYIVEHPTEYTFSAITASIDGEVEFIPHDTRGPGRNYGELRVDMQARFLINDGQHRRAALEEALKQRPELGDETMAVVFFLDAGLKRSQQMFADLNKHAVRPSLSIGVLYDHRDQMASLVKKLVNTIPIFKDRTELEKTSISNRSTKLFTLSGVYQATEALLKNVKADSHDKETLAKAYWERLTDLLPEWQWAIQSKVSPMDLRQNYVHMHGVVLHALGIVGGQLLETQPHDWHKRLDRLRNVDWSRRNKQWEGRAMVGGRMSKAQNNLALTVAYLKKVLDLPLTSEEQYLDKLLPTSNIGENANV
jgi:DNA sulfur modification protein DndB